VVTVADVEVTGIGAPELVVVTVVDEMVNSEDGFEEIIVTVDTLVTVVLFRCLFTNICVTTVCIVMQYMYV
jgi:hypothetical protein